MGINASAFILNFGLNLILIPQFSYVGAAVASAVAYLATNTLAIGILRLKFGISPFSRHSIRVYGLLPLLLLPVGLGASRIFTLSVLSLPIALVLVGIASLIVVFLVGGIQTEDAILVSYIEEKIDREIPLVRNYIPDGDV